jgi:hypothetical protein
LSVKLNTEPAPRGSSFCARAWSGWLRARIGDAGDGLVLGQVGDGLARVGDVAFHAQRQGFDALQQLEGGHRAHAGAEVAQALAPGAQQEGGDVDSSLKSMPWKPS